MKVHETESTLKAIVGLLVVLVAFGIFLLYITYQNNILTSGSYQEFMALAVVAAAFLLTIFYFVQKSSIKKSSIHRTGTTKIKKTKKRKK